MIKLKFPNLLNSLRIIIQYYYESFYPSELIYFAYFNMRHPVTQCYIIYSPWCVYYVTCALKHALKGCTLSSLISVEVQTNLGLGYFLHLCRWKNIELRLYFHLYSWKMCKWEKFPKNNKIVLHAYVLVSSEAVHRYLKRVNQLLSYVKPNQD